MRTGSNRACDSPGHAARLLTWRAKRLLRAGFPGDLADRLASDHRVDLHELLELTDRGCPPELAARILAPLEAAPSEL
jgi:hypothetical protein